MPITTPNEALDEGKVLHANIYIYIYEIAHFYNIIES